MCKYSRCFLLFILLLVVSTGYAKELVEPGKCVFNDFDIDALYYDANIKCTYSVSLKDIKEVLSSIYLYWSWDFNNVKRYKLFSKKYKAFLEKQYNVKSGVDYRVPESEYERFWSGYRINQIQIFGDNLMQVDLVIRWHQEGNYGIKTYIFNFKKIKDRWLIVDMNY